jgi:hypothetical protein
VHYVTGGLSGSEDFQQHEVIYLIVLGFAAAGNAAMPVLLRANQCRKAFHAICKDPLLAQSRGINSAPGNSVRRDPRLSNSSICSGVNGRLISGTPSASATALAIQTGVLIALPSATPLAPSGVTGEGLSRCRIFAAWKAGIAELGKCQNVVVKLGGLGMLFGMFDFHTRETPPSSEDLARAYKPYIETCIESFGPDRGMFESNFPPDGVSSSYSVLWNAFKRLAAGYSADEKAKLFSGTAKHVYRLA